MLVAASVHAHLHPARTRVTMPLAIGSVDSINRAQSLVWCHPPGHPCTESPLASLGGCPAAGCGPRPRPALPSPHRYSGLMCQTAPPRGLRTIAWSARLCRLPYAPAGQRPVPMLSPQSGWKGLAPYPAAPLQGSCPFLPAELRPHLTCTRYGALRLPPCWPRP
jgi:hypothetical protein